MAGEPAIRKVLAALKTVLSAGMATVTWHIDRPEDQPFGNAEYPAGNILHTGTDFEPFSHGETLHRAAISLDLIVGKKVGVSNSSQLDEIEADAVATLHANRTLAGLAQDVIPQSSEGNEQVAADEGARLLRFEILFLTPLGNHRTIIGAGGLVP